MPWIAALIGGAVGMYGGNQQRQAMGRASAAQQAATQQALEEQRRMYEQYMGNMSPWMTAGRNALTAEQQLMGLGPQGSAQNQLAALASSPGYQFRLQQGQNSLDSGLAARGGMGSGRAMQSGIDYNQNFASNEYGNRLNQLNQLSGMGAGAASGMGSAGMNYAQNYGNTLQGGANAYGAAQIGGTNAWLGGLLGGAQLGTSIYNAMNQPQQNQVPVQNQLTQSSVQPSPPFYKKNNYSDPNSSYWGGQNQAPY